MNNKLKPIKNKSFYYPIPTIYQLQNTTDAIKTLESEYLNLIPVFAKELHIFVHSNIYDEPLNQLAFELFHSEEILSQHLQHSSEQKWIEHPHNLMQHAKKIAQVTSHITQKIESHYAAMSTKQ